MGVRDAGRLEAAVAAQYQEVFGQTLYSDIYQKSAAVCRGIIGDHPFIDGNRRTGMLACITLLLLNGVVIDVTNKQLEDFAVEVATKGHSVEVIAIWLKDHSAQGE